MQALQTVNVWYGSETLDNPITSATGAYGGNPAGVVLVSGRHSCVFADDGSQTTELAGA